MYTTEVYSEKSLSREAYCNVRKSYFTKLVNKPGASDNEIAVFKSGELIGGVSLSSNKSLTEDEDLNSIFNFNKEIAGVKISQLWMKSKFNPRVLIYIFNEIIKNTTDETFFYGTLSLPFSFIKMNNPVFLKHKKIMSPKVSIETCRLIDEDATSSEGLRLFKTYMKLNADVLAAPAYCLSDETIKVVVGQVMKRANIKWILESYEKFN